jgi:hypothetical protein
MEANNNTQKENRPNYAQIISQQPNKFPKREQAMIIDAIEDTRLTDYATSIGKVIGPKNIISISKISNNRICTYLSSKQLADDFVTKFPEISIAGTRTKVRKLISSAKRIIISNVCSSISHHIIEQALKQTGLKLVPRITTLRAGIAGEEYAHIESFRRQVYVAPQPEETENLPTSIVISYEDTTYRIFTTYDEMICFLCKKTGHVAAKCPNPTENAMQQEDLPDTSDTEVIPQEKAQTENLEKDNQGKPPNKRKAKNTESTISKLTDPNSIETNTEEITFKEPNNQPKTYTAQEKTPKSKRVKRSQSAENLHRQPSSTESLTSVPDNTKESAYQQIKRIIMEDPTTLPLTHENFISFIESTYGHSNPEAELQRFTDDTEGVIQMIMTIHAAINNQSMKNRLTRLRKKLENKSKRKTTQQNVRQDSDTDDTY